MRLTVAVLWLHGSKMAGLSGQPFFFPSTRPGSFRSTPTRTICFPRRVTPLPLSLDDPLLRVRPGRRVALPDRFQYLGISAKGKPFSSGPVQPESFAPVDLRAGKRGILLRFAHPLDPESALQTDAYSVRRWNYKRTSKYGSPNYKMDGSPGSEDLPVSSIKLSRDKKTVFVGIPDMREVMQMEVSYDLAAQDRSPIKNKSFRPPSPAQVVSEKGRLCRRPCRPDR